MPLEAIYDTQEEIPEAHRELYTERDGKWECTGVNGLKTQADVDRVNEGLRKERIDHKATRDKFTPWADLDHEQVTTDLARIPELEAAVEAGAGGKIPEEKMNELVEGRVKQQTASLTRRVAELEAENATQGEAIVGFQGNERKRKIHDNVRAAMVDSKVLDTAHEDVLLLAERVFDVTDDGQVLVKDDVGAIPGADAAQWLTDMQPKRPHWWPASQGSGAKGSGTGGAGMVENPWSEGHWNMTNQGKYLNEHGRQKADEMAKRAGSHVGATRPAKKAA